MIGIAVICFDVAAAAADFLSSVLAWIELELQLMSVSA